VPLLLVAAALLAAASPAAAALADQIGATFTLMAEQFVQAFQPVEGLVVGVDGDLVYIDVGGERGGRVGQELAIYRKGAEYRVYDSRCPHQVTNIPHLALQGKRLTCPKHQWAFDVTTGQCVEKGNRPLREFKAKIEGGRLLAYW